MKIHHKDFSIRNIYVPNITPKCRAITSVVEGRNGNTVMVGDLKTHEKPPVDIYTTQASGVTQSHRRL